MSANQSRTKPVLAVVVALALAGIYFFTPIRQYFTLEAVVRLVSRLRANPAAPLIFIGAYTASCVLWPLTIFPVAGGVLFGFWKGFLLNTVAANIGAWITFFIARRFGRETVGKLMKGSLKSFDESATRNGFWAIFAFRMVGFPPFLVTNYGAGLSGVRIRDYVLGTFLGMLVWTVVFTYFADTLWKVVTTAGLQGFQRAAGQFFWPVMGGVVIMGAVIGLTIFLKKRMASKHLLSSVLAAGLVGAALVSPSHAGPAVDHSGFNRLLRAYVKNGQVNYEGFRKESSAFQGYLDKLEAARPEAFSSREEKAAFWINAYNASVIKGVLDHFPLKSVRDVPGFFDKIAYDVAGENLTLNAIEARARSLDDSRVHFALVCASSSCPFLRSEAYVPERLSEQLDDQARRFLADPMRGLRLDESGGILWLSQIFKWYGADFTKSKLPGFLASRLNSGETIKAIAPFLQSPVREKVESQSWTIRYMPYDWNLNKQYTREENL